VFHNGATRASQQVSKKQPQATGRGGLDDPISRNTLLFAGSGSCAHMDVWLCGFFFVSVLSFQVAVNAMT